MSRGRHRHAPPLHRMLVPSAVAAVALACAGGAWLVGDTGDPGVPALRLLTAAAAVAAVTGAVLLRRWDREAGRRVGEVRAARATAEWRAEERQAELETELEESLEIRRGVEGALRRKRAELERLRTEHAALLRRYANAETERASALEGRRQLALEAAGPAKALTAGAADHRQASGAPTPLTYLQADEALRRLRVNAARQREREEREARGKEEAAAGPAPERSAPVQPARPAQPTQPARPAQPRQDGTAPAPEPYGQRSGSRGSGAPKRGGFDFFGTQGAQKRRRAPGAPGSAAENPSDQEDDGIRAAGDAPGDPSAAVPRLASRAVAGKVIDLGGPDGEEDGEGAAPAAGETTGDAPGGTLDGTADETADETPGGTPGPSRPVGPVRGLRRTRT
ncbi:hypothetical protein [Streptomyces sp. DH37]|uniref:hypothetical protein n=1 Tax=Streptomyces sp. DH37 TaxID=3040122 RepID=UPI002441641A|nr:hypothetical protein [Streptomyces sp. DH37]MDG9704357.1 hypothetical protein [Streptomyces sp. DH37]